MGEATIGRRSALVALRRACMAVRDRYGELRLRAEVLLQRGRAHCAVVLMSDACGGKERAAREVQRECGSCLSQMVARCQLSRELHNTTKGVFKSERIESGAREPLERRRTLLGAEASARTLTAGGQSGRSGVARPCLRVSALQAGFRNVRCSGRKSQRWHRRRVSLSSQGRCTGCQGRAHRRQQSRVISLCM